MRGDACSARLPPVRPPIANESEPTCARRAPAKVDATREAKEQIDRPRPRGVEDAISVHAIADQDELAGAVPVDQPAQHSIEERADSLGALASPRSTLKRPRYTIKVYAAGHASTCELSGPTERSGDSRRDEGTTGRCRSMCGGHRRSRQLRDPSARIRRNVHSNGGQRHGGAVRYR